jgi:hypothetical protein
MELRFSASHRAVIASLLSVLALAGAPLAGASSASPPWRFEVSVDSGVTKEPVTGRLLLILGTRAAPEPRLAVHINGPVVIGHDLEQVRRVKPSAFPPLPSPTLTKP